MLAAGSAAAQPRPTGVPVVEWAADGKVLMAAQGLLARFDLSSDQEELLDSSGVTFALTRPDASGGARLALGGVNRLELRGYPDLAMQAVLVPPVPDSTQPLVIQALAWSPDGATLAAGTRSGHILLWDAETKELWGDVGVERPRAVKRLTFSADGARLLSLFEDGRAVLWSLEEREVVSRFPPPGESSEDFLAEAFLSPDGRSLLATRWRGEDAEMVLWSAEGTPRWRRSGYGVGLTPDGAGVLALAPPFRIAVLYRAADAEALRVFEPPEGVALLHTVRLSPDETQLLGVGEDYAGQVLIVWDFATAQILETRR